MRAAGLRRSAGQPPLFMGILNVTPDSFSDGGRWNTPAEAAAHAAALEAAGADIIDLGGESTRPDARPVPAEEELRRVLPALKAVRKAVSLPISVDTYKASVAAAALAAGADLINDVTGLADPQMAAAAAAADVPIIIMFIHGTPATFRTDLVQGDIMAAVGAFLRERTQTALTAGVKEDQIILDPGLGFGTAPEQAVTLLERCGEFSAGGRYPVLVGPSRKRFLKTAWPGLDADEATARACLVGRQGGADMVRVHAVAPCRQAFGLTKGIRSPGSPRSRSAR